MKTLGLVIVCALAVYGNIKAQGNNRILVKVEQINSSNGTINVAIFNSEEDFLNTPFMGIPNEPYGVSLKGKSMFGPPSYKDARFTLDNENARLIISLD